MHFKYISNRSKLFIGMVVAMLFMVSCEGTDDDLISITPSGSIEFSADGGSQRIVIDMLTEHCLFTKPNVGWMTVEEDPTYFGNAVLITVDPNIGEERTATVTFFASRNGKSRDDSVQLEVIQHGIDESGGNKEETGKETNFKFHIDGSSNVAQILTVGGNGDVNSKGNATSVSFSNSEIPQMAMALNKSGDVVMLSRGIWTSSSTMNIDATTTALALVTMHPLFAPVKGKAAFNALETMISNASSYAAYEREVANCINRGKELFDASNTALITAYENVLNDITVDPSVHPDTRAADIPGIDAGPFKVSVNGKKVTIQSHGLSPMYEGAIYDALNNEVTQIVIPSGESYGVTDLLLRDELAYGKPQTWDLSSYTEGEYYFTFSRMTNACLVDFTVNYICSTLDIVGACVSTVETSTIKQAIGKWVAARGVSLAGMIMSGTYSKMEIAEATFGAAVDFIDSDMFLAVVTVAQAAAIKAHVSKLSKVLTIYYALRGSCNTLARAYQWCDAPKTFEFCLCHSGHKNLYACDWVDLVPVSGNNQNGQSGKWLKDAIKVQVVTANTANMASQYIVRFTVEKGNGWLSSTEVYTDASYQAKTFWELGSECREQKVKVEVLDVASHEVISELPCFFTATATDVDGEGGETNVPAWMQGTWKMYDLSNDNVEELYITFTSHTMSLTSEKHPSCNFEDVEIYFLDTGAKNGYGYTIYDVMAVDAERFPYLKGLILNDVCQFDNKKTNTKDWSCWWIYNTSNYWVNGGYFRKI